MYEDIRAVRRPRNAPGASRWAEKFDLAAAEAALAFHQSFPEYAVTPLADLKNLAGALGVAGIYIKDESRRFGLNAFKVLGGSHCLGRYIGRRLGGGLPDYAALVSPETRARLGELTFVTATDGNHGRGIAWTANRLGQKSVVYMPAGSAAERLENIRALGADASITDRNYDGAVRLASERAEENGWILVQDTTWPGYEEIPTWIMQGYTTMALEAVRQLGDARPTHVFLQAGVGAMAGALTAFFVHYYGKNRPKIIVVEPDKADCFYRSACVGEPRAVGGAMDTIMAGLACGEPCTIAWDILRAYADWFVSMPDWVAAQGMRVLGNPLGGDPCVVSGESGASTAGLVTELLRSPARAALREQFGLDSASRILCVSTEGDTDRRNYRGIVWDGAFARPAESGAK